MFTAGVFTRSPRSSFMCLSLLQNGSVFPPHWQNLFVKPWLQGADSAPWGKLHRAKATFSSRLAHASSKFSRKASASLPATSQAKPCRSSGHCPPSRYPGAAHLPRASAPAPGRWAPPRPSGWLRCCCVDGCAPACCSAPQTRCVTDRRKKEEGEERKATGSLFPTWSPS